MPLDREFNYYLEHQNELLKKYNNRFLVIIEEKVVDDFATLEEAAEQTAKKYKLGTFLIQKCTEGDSAYTATFYSRAKFN